MAEYIAAEDLYKCSTCWHLQNNKCNAAWCESGESWHPAYDRLKKSKSNTVGGYTILILIKFIVVYVAMMTVVNIIFVEYTPRTEVILNIAQDVAQ